MSSLSSRPPGCEERCPACRYRDVTYAESLDAKERYVRSRLERWSGAIETIRGVDHEGWGYRRSLFLHTDHRSEGWKAGVIRREGRDEELIPIPKCPLHLEGINERLTQALRLLDATSELKLFGLLVRGSLLSLVLKERKSDERVSGLRSLGWGTTGFQGVHLNFNPSAGNRILASKGWVHLWGKEEAVLPAPLGHAHGPSSFAQQIPGLHADSVEEAARFLTGDRSLAGIIDLCSGTGVTLARWTREGMRTIGVELGREAVTFARRHGEILEGKVSERLPQLTHWVKDARRFGIYANPSRLGLEPELIEWMGQHPGCERMVYLSCSPGTLARDLDLLDSIGMKVTRVIPYDFLPRSGHVEVLVMLERPRPETL